MHIATIPLEHPAQRIALAEPFVPRATEHRVVGNLVLDAELAEPPVRKIDLDLGTQSPLRADRKHGQPPTFTVDKAKSAAG
jgi:hypothetical protein